MSAFRELAGKVGVVTGGASGIGLGIARRMKAAGMKVVIADVEERALKSAGDALGALAVRADVRSYESVKALADRVVDAYGTAHVVCNNAGVAPMAKIENVTLDDWKWMMDVNLWGVIHGVHAFLPLLKANADGGHIVNTSSMSGLAATPTLGPYCVTKFGIVALSETLEAELTAEGSLVGVSVLCPGPVRTRIGRSSRNRPEDTSQQGLRDMELEEVAHFQGQTIPYVEPDAVGELVLSAVRSGDFYIQTHPELFDFIFARHARIEASVQSALRAKAAVSPAQANADPV
jgi:NAD(P)-dependent dehydrogenase (short-subunit alcohol dehydrogenase family)